jgi:hypothetical protein
VAWFLRGDPAEVEQTAFSAEDDKVQKPASIPDDVLKLLASDERVSGCLSTDNVSAQDLSGWFSASEISLNADSYPDYVIAASNPCLFGANINPFWVFVGSKQGHFLALNVYVHDLNVQSARHAGFRDIVTFKLSSTTIYESTFHFKNGEYVVAHSSNRPIE